MASYMGCDKKSNSVVWKHFLREEKGETAMCNYTDCKKILKIGGGSTKGSNENLLSADKIKFTPATISANTPDEPPTTTKKNVNQLFSDIGARRKITSCYTCTINRP